MTASFQHHSCCLTMMSASRTTAWEKERPFPFGQCPHEHRVGRAWCRGVIYPCIDSSSIAIRYMRHVVYMHLRFASPIPGAPSPMRVACHFFIPSLLRYHESSQCHGRIPVFLKQRLPFLTCMAQEMFLAGRSSFRNLIHRNHPVVPYSRCRDKGIHRFPCPSLYPVTTAVCTRLSTIRCLLWTMTRPPRLIRQVHNHVRLFHCFSSISRR